MDAHRSAEQVTASARAMDQARAAGLPDAHLATLLAARDAWWHQTRWPGRVALIEAISHPAARLVDQTLVAAIRRHLR